MSQTCIGLTPVIKLIRFKIIFRLGQKKLTRRGKRGHEYKRLERTKSIHKLRKHDIFSQIKMCTMPRFFTAICLTILFVASKSQGKQNWGFFTMHIISISAFESVNVPHSSLSWNVLDWSHFKFFTQHACKRYPRLKEKLFFIDLWKVIGHSDSETLWIAPINHLLAPHYCLAHPFLGSWDSWFFCLPF